MSRKVGIIGIGNVGSTVAHQLVVCGYVDDLVMIDKNVRKVSADAEDLIEAMPNLPHHVNITVNDYSALKKANVIISAVGYIALQRHNPNRYKELSYNLKQVSSVGKKIIKESGFHGLLVDITNPCDILTAHYQAVTGFPKSRVMGTGTLLDTARMKNAVGKALNIDPRSVSGFNLGEHGNTQFTAFSTVRALGHPIAKIAAKHHVSLSDIDKTAREGGTKIMLGKHHTNFAVAAAAVCLTNFLLSDAKAEVSVSHFCKDYGNYMSTPEIVGRDGIEGDVHINITDEERRKLRYSSNFIKKQTKKFVK